jgi:hypothetical protein
MKVSCCSRSYGPLLRGGSLTQLEWIDRCAELRFDGVEFAASHFPRVDDDYLAQLKKVCVDRGLTPSSVALDLLLGAGDVDAQAGETEHWIARAESLGAPIVRMATAPAEGSPPIAWRELIRAFKRICARAKERNVTVALEAAHSSLVTTPADVKRAFKECDSAWLRLAINGADLSGADAAGWLASFDACVLAVGDDAETAPATAAACAAHGYIGFLSLDSSSDDPDASLARTLSALREPIAR